MRLQAARALPYLLISLLCSILTFFRVPIQDLRIVSRVSIPDDGSASKNPILRYASTLPVADADITDTFSKWVCASSMCRYVLDAAEDKPWGNFRDVENLIVFGDSYASSDSHYDPQPPYHTSCNGPNYVDVLTSIANHSIIATKDYAIPGSAVDWTLIQNEEQTGNQNDFVHQLETFKEDIRWDKFSDLRAENTVYVVEFGINDIIYSEERYYANLTEAVMVKYTNLLEEVCIPPFPWPEVFHQLGPPLSSTTAFIILLVPPLDRSPAASPPTPSNTHWPTSITSYNSALRSLIPTHASKYTNSTFFLLDTHALFTRILDDPSSSPHTARLKDVEHTCAAYEGGIFWFNNLPGKSWKSEECESAVDEYFWLQMFHPTWRVHAVMGEEIMGGLGEL